MVKPLYMAVCYRVCGETAIYIKSLINFTIVKTNNTPLIKHHLFRTTAPTSRPLSSVSTAAPSTAQPWQRSDGRLVYFCLWCGGIPGFNLFVYTQRSLLLKSVHTNTHARINTIYFDKTLIISLLTSASALGLWRHLQRDSFQVEKPRSLCLFAYHISLVLCIQLCVCVCTDKIHPPIHTRTRTHAHAHTHHLWYS